MAYTGKVEISNSWAKLEDLIKEQIEDQSSFAFDSDTTYELQCEGDWGARFSDSSTVPTDEDMNEGFCIMNTQVAHYKPSSNDLYVRTKHGTLGYLKIGVMGK